MGNVSVRLSSFRRRPESMEPLHQLPAWTPASAGVTVRALHTQAVETDRLPGFHPGSLGLPPVLSLDGWLETQIRPKEEKQHP